MTFWGKAEEGEMLLGAAKEICLKSDVDAPADLLIARFPSIELSRISEFVAYHEGELVFSCIVDEISQLTDKNGSFTTITARSLAAVLLDNEAPPQTLINPSLRVITERLLKPLGFAEIVGEMRGIKGKLEINKGESCWSALERFCRIFLGTSPYVDEHGTLHAENAEGELFEAQNITSLEVIEKPCEQLSCVYAQSESGAYDAAFKNPLAATTKVRYNSTGSRKSAPQRIREAEERSFEVRVKCEGFQRFPRGSRLRLRLENEVQQMTVKSYIYRLNQNGEETQLLLKRG